MKTTKRFENAVMKLYNAFHENTLDSFDCQNCAVGNICDNNSNWANARLTVSEGWDYNNKIAKETALKSNYSLKELEIVEGIFVKEVPYELKTDKETQFKGLCAVVEYLAGLDNIPNPMDYTKLFETENNKPIYELTF
jgi:hypothetical protein